ncbi:MAG: hypothetical protein AAFN00_16180, partial [Cyanobacteria bacterium J06558_2]
MNQINFSTSACRYCRYYKPQGRRGGECKMLGVAVQSNWKACALASSPFKTTLTKLEDIFQLSTPITLNSAPQPAPSKSNVSSLENSQPVIAPQRKTADSKYPT